MPSDKQEVAVLEILVPRLLPGILLGKTMVVRSIKGASSRKAARGHATSIDGIVLIVTKYRIQILSGGSHDL